MKQEHSGGGDNIAGNKYVIFKFGKRDTIIFISFATFILFIILYLLTQQKYSQQIFESKKLLVDLPARWDSSKVANIVLKELSQMKNENEIRKDHFDGEDKLQHFILNFYDYDKFGDNNFSKVAIAYSRPENGDCHGCEVALSFIQFVKVESGWQLGEKYIAAIYDGAFGEPPSNIGVFSIGYNILGIMIEGGYTNQGYSTSNNAIFANVGGELKKVLEYVSYENDSGTIKPGSFNWESNLEPQKIGTGFYDLVLLRTGIENGKKTNDKILYKYNGIKYIEVN
jgi:hypothetical protein